jgi:ubiquinone/menaquinone biosynthesis C-methylase UbiE
VDEDIRGYYDLGLEQDRLRADTDLERLRTEDIIFRHLPTPPGVICDVGGGAGIYAFALARRGYLVHLIDLIPLHLRQAHSYAVESGTSLASISVGDARALAMPAAHADAVLLLGPLYHLIEDTERVEALHEARRILKPGGLLFAAAISRFASLIDGLSTGAFADPEFRQIVRSDLSSGRHRNPTGLPQYFTTAHFHQPGEFRSEIAAAGFRDVKLFGIEGPTGACARLRSAVADPVQRSTLLDMLAAIEEEPSIIGASAHIMGIARKPR